MPEFPEFKTIELQDRETIQDFFTAYRPETSELTFTNIFIWREHYKIVWSVHRDWLIVACNSGTDKCFALPPVGPPGRAEVCRAVLEWLRERKGVKDPALERADSRLVDELGATGKFTIEPARGHFDYLYKTENLIRLSGNRLHAKKNHLNKFRKTYKFSYEPVTPSAIPDCLKLAESWCHARRCQEDLDLTDEAQAVKSILENFAPLHVAGGLIRVEGKVEAFALGEMLNADTAVIHVEKANPEIPQAFVAINQQFCEHEWPQVPFINREQDLGDPGLRQAKLSYQPERLIPKFRIKLS